MKLLKLLLCFSAFTIFGAGPSVSGPFTDELARCMIVNTTQKDQITLVNWIWFAMSVHPDIQKNMGAKVLDEEKKDADKKVAYLISNLFLDKCKEESKAALEYEGAQVADAFGSLGQIAMGTLMQNKEVEKSLFAYINYVNPTLLEMIGKYE